jgi:hypothetical protein
MKALDRALAATSPEEIEIAKIEAMSELTHELKRISDELPFITEQLIIIGNAIASNT